VAARHVVVAALIVALVSPVVRADQGAETNIWRTYAARLEPNAFVRVRMANGKSVKGRIVLAGSDALRVNPRKRLAVPPRDVPYDEIVAIDLEKEPRWNPAVKVLLGVGIGFGAFLLFSAIAIAAGGYD